MGRLRGRRNLRRSPGNVVGTLRVPTEERGGGDRLFCRHTECADYFGLRHLHFDPFRGGLWSLRQPQRQHAVGVLGIDVLGVEPFGQRHRAVEGAVAGLAVEMPFSFVSLDSFFSPLRTSWLPATVTFRSLGSMPGSSARTVTSLSLSATSMAGDHLPQPHSGQSRALKRLAEEGIEEPVDFAPQGDHGRQLAAGPHACFARE